jgi:hypothetical protein
VAKLNVPSVTPKSVIAVTIIHGGLAPSTNSKPRLPASAAPTLTRNGPRSPLVRAPVSDAAAATTDIGSVTSRPFPKFESYQVASSSL